MRPTCVALAGLGLALLLLPSAVRADDAADLESLRRAIEARREQVERYQHEEKGLFETIEAMDEAARALAADANRASVAARQAGEALVALEAQSRDLEQRLAGTRRALGTRAVALYKAGEVGVVRLIFAAGSLPDRLARIQALQRLVDHDARLLERYDTERQALAQARADAQAAAERRDVARERLARRSAELRQERQAKRDLLVQVRKDRARERALLNELEAAARELEQQLSEIRERSDLAPSGNFAAARGRLEAPVGGRVLRGFGRVVDREYRTETFRKGMDFAVDRGDPVYAVAPGTVRYAGWFRGYGRLVIIDHGDDYFTVSGHLEEVDVSVDDTLAAGDAIGRAGETGSLSGPRLYFEIRRGSEALDPADWLQLPPAM